MKTPLRLFLVAVLALSFSLGSARESREHGKGENQVEETNERELHGKLLGVNG